MFSWKSNEMLEKSIEKITKSNSHFAPIFVNQYILGDVNFNGHCLINNNISVPFLNIVNFFLQEYFKMIWCLFQIKNALTILIGTNHVCFVEI